MNKLKKRTFTLLTALSMLLASIPVYAESPTVETETSKEYITPKGICMATDDELRCLFTVNVDEMQHYEDSEIPLDFAIQGIEETQQLTISIDGTVPLEHNQSELQVYTTENNEVSLRITILEPAKRQDVENLEYERITINLQNAEGENVHSIEASVINTQHGVFVSYINEEMLFLEYLEWLKDNAYISTMRYNSVNAEHHTVQGINTTNDTVSTMAENSRASDYQTPYTVRIDYTIATYDSGETLYINGTVTWGATNGAKKPARFLEVDLCDKEISNTYTTLATTNTSATGSFSFTVDNATGIFENGYDISIKAKAKSPYGNVCSDLQTTYFYVDCGDNIKSNISGLGVAQVKSIFSNSVYLLDSFVTGANYVKEMSGVTMPCIHVTYPHTDLMQDFYYPSCIQITEESFDSWDTVLHEYGHYVADYFDILPYVKMAHDQNQNLISYLQIDDSIPTLALNPKMHGCELAWQEGWATYFCVSAQIHQNAKSLNIPDIGDTLFYGNSIEINMNTNNRWSKGEGHEFAIARALWDMADIQGSTYEATDNDPINLGFQAVWDLVMNSEAISFSAFMQYFYTQYSKTSYVYLNVGSILADHKITGYVYSLPVSSTSGYLSWYPAYSNTYVTNTHYLEIYNLNMTKIYTFNMGSTGYTYTISSGLWQSICSQYGNGFYVAVRTVPEESEYATGPYYSKFELYIP
jgi:hypothetical protein